jgi:hypothetical protein
LDFLGGVLPLAVSLLVVAGAIVAACTNWARRTDERIMRSPFGWVLPGGIGAKLGEKDSSPDTKWWPYILGGPWQGLLYNSARRRRAAEALPAEETAVQAPKPMNAPTDPGDDFVLVRPSRRRREG